MIGQPVKAEDEVLPTIATIGLMITLTLTLPSRERELEAQ